MDCKLDAPAVLITVEEDFWPDEMPALAMTYSPWQEWDTVYEAEVGLKRGTIFPGLDKPFCEGACSCV